MPTLQCTNLKTILNKANTPNQITVNLDYIYASVTNWKSIKSKLSKNLGSLQSISFTPKKEKSLSDPEIVSKLPIKPSFIVDFSNKPLIYDYINIYGDYYYYSYNGVQNMVVHLVDYIQTFEPLSKTPHICKTSYSEVSRHGITEYHGLINIKCAQILLFKINLKNLFYGAVHISLDQRWSKTEDYRIIDLITSAYKNGLTKLLLHDYYNPYGGAIAFFSNSRFNIHIYGTPRLNLVSVYSTSFNPRYELYKKDASLGSILLNRELFYYLILIIMKDYTIETTSTNDRTGSGIQIKNNVYILSVSPYGSFQVNPAIIPSPFFEEKQQFYYNQETINYFNPYVDNNFNYLETPIIENHKKVILWSKYPRGANVSPSVSWYEFYITDLISDWSLPTSGYYLNNLSLAHKVIPLARKIGEIVEKEFKYESEGSQITLFYDGPLSIGFFVGRLVFLFKIQTVRFLRKYVLMTLPCLLSFSSYNTKLTYKRLLRVSHISLSLLYQTLNLYFNKLINLNKLILHFNFIGLKWFFLNNLQLSINLPNLTLLRGFIDSVDFLSLIFSFQTKLLKNYVQRTDFIILQLINTTLLDKLQFLSLNYYFPNIKFWYIKYLLRTISTQLSCSGNVLLLKSFTVGLQSKKCGS